MSDLIQTPELANRFARAIASDIALYHEEKILGGIKNDDLFDVIADEIEEGKRLYDSRVAKEIAEKQAFYERALVDLIFKAKGDQVPDAAIW